MPLLVTLLSQLLACLSVLIHYVLEKPPVYRIAHSLCDTLFPVLFLPSLRFFALSERPEPTATPALVLFLLLILHVMNVLQLLKYVSWGFLLRRRWFLLGLLSV